MRAPRFCPGVPLDEGTVGEKKEVIVNEAGAWRLRSDSVVRYVTVYTWLLELLVFDG